MGRFSTLAAGIVAISLVVSAPAKADSMSGAEKLRRLDIMLMVTALRCRTTADGFQADYEAFSSNHLDELNGAARVLTEELAGRYGSAGATRALDRLSTTMANQYGQGHPWLGCHDLKQVAHDLALAQGAEVLDEAADQLLTSDGGTQIALARR